jgi:hypothetical protein
MWTLIENSSTTKIQKKRLLLENNQSDEYSIQSRKVQKFSAVDIVGEGRPFFTENQLEEQRCTLFDDLIALFSSVCSFGEVSLAHQNLTSFSS